MNHERYISFLYNFILSCFFFHIFWCCWIFKETQGRNEWKNYIKPFMILNILPQYFIFLFYFLNCFELYSEINVKVFFCFINLICILGVCCCYKKYVFPEFWFTVDIFCFVFLFFFFLFFHSSVVSILIQFLLKFN